jgi:LysM repeat protein
MSSTSAATTASTVRLTRRGRFVVISVLATLLLAAFLIGRTGTSIASTDKAAPKPYALTTVQPGETLWTVAKRVAPGHDPRALVAQITSLNHLNGGAVQAGQQLLLPRAA